MQFLVGLSATVPMQYLCANLSMVQVLLPYQRKMLERFMYVICESRRLDLMDGKIVYFLYCVYVYPCLIEYGGGPRCRSAGALARA